MPEGDGILEVPVSHTEENEMPGITISETAAELLAQHALNGAQRQADASANVAEQTRLAYLESKEKIGVREAQAMQDVRTSQIAREVVQQRSVRDQPQA